MKLPSPCFCVIVAVAGLLLAACARELPVSVDKGDSLVGQGIQLTVTTTTCDHLRQVLVETVTQAGEIKDPNLGPQQSVNIGWLELEDWPILDGSEVTVSAKGYGQPAAPRLEEWHG